MYWVLRYEAFVAHVKSQSRDDTSHIVLLCSEEGGCEGVSGLNRGLGRGVNHAQEDLQCRAVLWQVDGWDFGSSVA